MKITTIPEEINNDHRFACHDRREDSSIKGTVIRRSPQKYENKEILNPPSSCNSDNSLSSQYATGRRRKRTSNSRLNLLQSFELYLLIRWIIIFSIGYLAFYQWHKTFILPMTVKEPTSLPSLPSPTDNFPILSPKTNADSRDSSDGIIRPEPRLSDRPKVVHIIHTRFMQHQPELVQLGLARLKLLEGFFLQSLKRQTHLNFVCVIRIDPKLNSVLRQSLLKLFKSLPFSFVVIDTNENPHSQYWDILRSENTQNERITSGGNLTQVRTYLSKCNRILESRLDVDDGLNKFFVEDIQTLAVSHFKNYEKHPQRAKSWKLWCASAHLEWQFVSVSSTSSTANNSTGTVVNVRSDRCITAGLTIAFVVPSDATKPDFPRTNKHTKVHQTFPKCVYEKAEDPSGCFEFMGLVPTALRARTPTSAGMLNIVLTTDSTANKDYQKLYLEGAKKQQKGEAILWKGSETYFGFNLERARDIHEYLDTHMKEITLDNLKGQCTEGHSCKESSRQQLQSIIQAYT